MSINLHTAVAYKIEISDILIYGVDSKEALYDLFQEFEITHNADDEFDNEYDVNRSELQRFRNDVANHTKYFRSRAKFFAEKLEIIKLTEKQFILFLDRLINESDQDNEQVLLAWF